MSIKRRPPRDQRPAEKVVEGDSAVLDRDDETNAPSWRARTASSDAIGTAKASSAAIIPTETLPLAAIRRG